MYTYMYILFTLYIRIKRLKRATSINFYFQKHICIYIYMYIYQNIYIYIYIYLVLRNLPKRLTLITFNLTKLSLLLSYACIRCIVCIKPHDESAHIVLRRLCSTSELISHVNTVANQQAM